MIALNEDEYRGSIDPNQEVLLPNGQRVKLSQLSLEAEKELKRRKARENYYDYVQYTNPDYIKGKVYEYLCNTIDKFIKTKTEHAYDILLLSMPPQHGKSLTVTETLPSYCLGITPKSRTIIVSYNDDFAEQFGRRNREKVELYGDELFGIKLADVPNSVVEFELQGTHGGCKSSGIKGTITGKPAKYLIIDDPIKNETDADSDVSKEFIQKSWGSVIKSRLAPNAKVIVIQTRWRDDDYFGYIQQLERNVTTINLPCECDDPKNDPLGRKLGDALAPEIGKDNKWLKDFKWGYSDENGARTWESMFQGHPYNIEGNIIKRSWWKFYEITPPRFDYISISIDATFKDTDTSDYVAITTWGKLGKNMYLLDLINKQLNFVDTCSAIRATKLKYPTSRYIYIEDKANGPAVIEILQKEFIGIIPIQPKGGKQSRLNAVSAAIESGHVFLPKFSAFTTELVAQFAAFPKGKHDDIVDSSTQALNRMIHVEGEYFIEAASEIKYNKYTPDQWEDYDSADSTTRKELEEKWGVPDDSTRE